MKSTNNQIIKPKEIDPVDIPSYIGIDRNRFRNLVAGKKIEYAREVYWEIINSQSHLI